MRNMYNPSIKKWVDVPDEQVDQKYQEGFMFAKGEKIDVFFPYSKRKLTVDASEFDEAMEGGGRYLTGSMRQQNDREARLSGGEGKWLAAKAGFLGGGLVDPVGDALLAKMSDYTPDDIATARETHPWTAGATGVIGFASTLLATGGMGSLAKALGFGGTKLAGLGAAKYLLPPVASTKVATTVGKAALGKMGLSGLTAAELAASATSKKQLAKIMGGVAIGEGAGGMVEGAAYALGRTVAAPWINEEEIGTPEEIGDALIHDMGLFGLLSGGMGLAFTGTAMGTPAAIQTLSNRVQRPLGERWAKVVDKLTLGLNRVNTPEEVKAFLVKARNDPEWVDRAIGSEQTLRETADSIADVIVGYGESLHQASRKHTGATKAAAMYRKTRGLDPDQPLGPDETYGSVIAEQVDESIIMLDAVSEGHRAWFAKIRRKREMLPTVYQIMEAADEVFPEFLKRAGQSGVKFRYATMGNHGPVLQFAAPVTGNRKLNWQSTGVRLDDFPLVRELPKSETPGLTARQRKKEEKKLLEDLIDERIAEQVNTDFHYAAYKATPEYKAYLDEVTGAHENQTRLLAELNAWRVGELQRGKKELLFYGKEGKQIKKDTDKLHAKIIAEGKKRLKDEVPEKFFDADSLKVHYWVSDKDVPFIRLETRYDGAYDFASLGTKDDLLQREFYDQFHELSQRRITLGAKPGQTPDWLAHPVTHFERKAGVINLHRAARGGKTQYSGHLSIGGLAGKLNNLPPHLKELADFDGKLKQLRDKGAFHDDQAEKFVASKIKAAQNPRAKTAWRKQLTGETFTHSEVIQGEMKRLNPEKSLAVTRKIMASILQNDSIGQSTVFRGQMGLTEQGQEKGLKDFGAWMFRHMDDTKKLIDKSAEHYKELPDGTNMNLGKYAGMQIGKTNNTIRRHLEKAPLWGEAATAQAEVNAGFKAVNDVRNDVFESFGDFVSRQTRPDPHKTREYLSELADNAWGRKTPSGESAVAGETGHISTERMEEIVKATKKLVTAIRTHYADPEFGAKTLSAIGIAEQKLPRLVEDLNAGRAIAELDKGRMMPSLVVGGLGFLTGVPVGVLHTPAALSMLQVAAPAAYVQTRARVQKYLTQKAVAMGERSTAVAETVANGKFTQRRLAVTTISRTISRAVANAEVLAQEDREETPRHLSKRTGEAQAMANAVSSIVANPELLARVTTEPLYPLEGAPKTQDGVSNKTMNALNYLNTQHPVGMNKTIDMTTGKQKFMTTDVAASQYMDMTYALSAPIDYMGGGFQAGRLTVPGMKAIAAVYPDLCAEFRLLCREQLAGGEVPAAMGTQLSLLLGAPATAMNHGQIVGVLQGLHKSKKEEQERKNLPGKRGLHRGADELMSATQRVG